MNDQTLPQSELNQSTSERDTLSVRKSLEYDDSSYTGAMQTVAIAATFTADPLRSPLQFWMDTLELSTEIVIAPYAQVMQELLAPSSVLSSHRTGFNVLLIRLEDWIRDRLQHSHAQNLRHLRAVARDFQAAAVRFRARTSPPMFIYFCPISATLPASLREELGQLERELVARLSALPHTECWTHTDVMRLYALSTFADARADRIAHIPYTSEYFVAMATFLARRMAVHSKPQRKVIAVDCDNTLWKGIVGEDGAENVEFTSEHLELQKLLVRQHDAGVLICLCSKNNPDDVDAVFRSRPEMLLREEHLVGSRVNWNSKSSNLQSLAKELGLALDSFIFIDDSRIECEEVRTHCAPVLTLQLPDTAEEITHFLEHVWAFDRLVVTQEAARRTQQYKENRARSQALEEATDLNQFLASLQLEVDIATVRPEQIERVAELVQRTNQFNLTGTRRRASELEALIGSGELHCLVTHVRDRFGDYGLVGAVLFRSTGGALEVDTLVLSCRALGRGVEHRIVNELGRQAGAEGLATVVLQVRTTNRNEPARKFLQQSFGQFRVPLSNGEECTETRYVVPVAFAERVSSSSLEERPRESRETTSAKLPTAPIAPSKWHEMAYRLSRLDDIVNAIDQSAARVPTRRAAYVAPRTPTEMAIAGIWVDVLKCDAVGVQDDFFDLGGDSLQAVQVIARIASMLGVEPALHRFFEQPTVEHVAALIAEAPPQTYSPIPVADRSRPIPLSWSQQRLWFINELEGGSPAYHIPLGLMLRGKLQVATLQRALDAMVCRHEALRTVVGSLDATPTQKVGDRETFLLTHADLRSSGDAQAELDKQMTKEQLTPFDLRNGPLIRGRLLRLLQDEHVLLITVHHLISDGWSMGVFLRELGMLYHAFRDGRSNVLPPLGVQYADYALWQYEWLQEARLQAQLHYWKTHLSGAPALLELPTDRARPATLSYRGGSVHVSIPPDLTAGLKALARQSNVTLAMSLYAAWFVLLSRLSGQHDLVVGMPVANRPRAELEGVIGLFVNTLALRLRLAEDQTVENLLQRVKQVMLGAYSNQDLPFEKVVEALQPERSLGYSPIVQVLFVFQNAPAGELRMPELAITQLDSPLQTAQFDLSLSLGESAGAITGALNFAADLFDAATIHGWSRCFTTLLRGMVGQPQLELCRLPILDDQQRLRTLETFNRTEGEYPRQALIPELFETQARRTPDATAIVCDGGSLSYAELDWNANRLAHYLIAAGVRANDVVGICLGRGIEWFVSWLGILKAGGAYLPLDPTYPVGRLSYMLHDANPKIVLTQEAYKARLQGSSLTATIVSLDGDWRQIESCSVANPCFDGDPALRARSLAYVIYTSGSTGSPKAVMIEHRNVLNLWQGLETLYQRAGECRRVALNASFNFDASVQQLVQLLAGRSIFLVPEDVRRDPAALLEFLERHAIDVVDCTPSQLRSWIAAGLLRSVRRTLQLILVGGEAIDRELWRSLASSGIDVHNVYGPTECTVDATAAALRDDPGPPHVGKPMMNRRIYILDHYLQSVPEAVAGEIYVGAEGVGRGYLNRAGLTAQRFVPDPFSPVPGARMYRTGDIGRWRSSGLIEYLGRNDGQVKIRGFRVELGEIEAQLLGHALVVEAVVVTRQGASGEQRLIAYVVPKHPSDPSFGEVLRSHLNSLLPEHMVPAAFVILHQMPHTSSGKVDRRGLPEPGRDAYVTAQFEAPRGEVEEALADIWRSLLRVPQVGRDDNFFRLGGTSLSAMQLQARMQPALSIEAPMRIIFEAPTLRELAARLEELRRRRLLEKVARRGASVQELLGKVASMRPAEIQRMLRDLTTEGRQ